MLSNDEYRRMLNRPDLSDKEVDKVRRGLQAFLDQVLDEYFRDELGPGPGE